MSIGDNMKLSIFMALVLVAVVFMVAITPMPTMATESSYDYNSGAGTLHFIYEGTTNFEPVYTSGDGLAGTEISSYTNVLTDNTQYISCPDYGANFDPFYRFNFTIAESEGNVAWMDWHINGYALYGGGEDGNCYIANFDTPSWEKICDMPTSDGNCDHNITSSLTSYIDGNNQVVAVCVGKNMDEAADLSIDYVSLTVGYSESAGDTCDTCTIDCTENCIVDSALDCSGSDITFTGSGLIKISADITNYDDVEISGGCGVECHGGYCLI